MITYLRNTAEHTLQQSDNINGGFVCASKFLSSIKIQFLLEHYHFIYNEEALI
jgi:uncharacterized protein YyaL (SSP411 family)